MSNVRENKSSKDKPGSNLLIFPIALWEALSRGRETQVWGG